MVYQLFLFWQTVQTASELRKPVYHGVAIKALPCDQVRLYMHLEK